MRITRGMVTLVIMVAASALLAACGADPSPPLASVPVPAATEVPLIDESPPTAAPTQGVAQGVAQEAPTATSSPSDVPLGLDVGNPSSIVTHKEDYSPYLDYNYPDRVFWGDTHLHTSFSTDAGLFGNRLGPDDAYRFAKGEKVTSSTGVPARLLRPLDWLVVADHAENLGLAPMIAESNPALLQSEWGRTIHDLSKAGRP